MHLCTGQQVGVLYGETQEAPDALWIPDVGPPAVVVTDFGFSPPGLGPPIILDTLDVVVQGVVVQAYPITWHHKVTVTRADQGLLHYHKHSRHPRTRVQRIIRGEGAVHYEFFHLHYGTHVQNHCQSVN